MAFDRALSGSWSAATGDKTDMFSKDCPASILPPDPSPAVTTTTPTAGASREHHSSWAATKREHDRRLRTLLKETRLGQRDREGEGEGKGEGGSQGDGEGACPGEGKGEGGRPGEGEGGRPGEDEGEDENEKVSLSVRELNSLLGIRPRARHGHVASAPVARSRSKRSRMPRPHPVAPPAVVGPGYILAGARGLFATGPVVESHHSRGEERSDSARQRVADVRVASAIRERGRVKGQKEVA